MDIPPTILLRFDATIAGARFKLAIKEKGWIQYKVAEELGISRRLLNYWHKGKNFKYCDAKTYASYLGLDLDWFLYPPNLFDEKEFLTQVQLSKQKHRYEVLEGTFLFTFSGDDTLSIIRFCQTLEKLQLLDRVNVNVNGKHSHLDTKIMISGTVQGYTLDGYIRTLRLIDTSGRIWSIGGGNAYLEDIAASAITFTVGQECQSYLLNTPFYVYKDVYVHTETGISYVNRGIEFDRFSMERLFSIGHHATVINLAKLKGCTTSLDILVSMRREYLSKHDRPLLADAFRLFTCLYTRSSELTKKITQHLITNLNSCLLHDEKDTAIYYMESLGYCAIYDQESFESFLRYSQLIMNKPSNNTFPQLQLACLIALKRKRMEFGSRHVNQQYKDIIKQLEANCKALLQAPALMIDD